MLMQCSLAKLMVSHNLQCSTSTNQMPFDQRDSNTIPGNGSPLAGTGFQTANLCNQVAFHLYPVMHFTESYIHFLQHTVKSFKLVLKCGRATTMKTFLTVDFAVRCVSS